MGAFRYETFADKAKSFKYNSTEEAKKRICRYQETGNTEHLVDAANMLLLEFRFGSHPNKHWKEVDDGEHATKFG